MNGVMKPSARADDAERISAAVQKASNRVGFTRPSKRELCRIDATAEADVSSMDGVHVESNAIRAHDDVEPASFGAGIRGAPREPTRPCAIARSDAAARRSRPRTQVRVVDAGARWRASWRADRCVRTVARFARTVAARRPWVPRTMGV